MAKKSIVLAVMLALVASVGIAPAMAYNCPVEIKKAEDMIKKAEKMAKSDDSKALLTEARKLLALAKDNHEKAKMGSDHAMAVGRAKSAQTLAEEAERRGGGDR